ncbi:MAG: hypothetical protein BWK76_13240 [Desulfobulbaceae bacterium A2]|nr:MAG: hypothetical protein BWK76_13240 [Desulfobulbaceae bacterium A2]
MNRWTRDVSRRLASYIRLQRAEWDIRRAARQGLLEVSFAPSSLNLMMADTCNSQCVMCGKDYRACGSGRYLSLDDVRTIYGHLNMNRLVDVIYGGGGEPFLNPELGEIAAYTRRHYPYVHHLVISNGIGIRQEVAEMLLRYGTHFLVSVNAATAETFRDVAGVDAFDRVVEHIAAIVRVRDNFRSPARISLSMILMQRNVRELVEFVRLAKRLGADNAKVMYARIYPEDYRKKSGNARMIQSEDSLYYHQDLSDTLMREAAQIARSEGIPFDHPPLFGEAFQERGRDCRDPWRSLFINFNGDVYPCPASEILFRPKVESGMYNSGNILQNHYSDFWNNRFWRELRRTCRERDQVDVVQECLCCGSAICWRGPGYKPTHVLDWSAAESSSLKL